MTNAELFNETSQFIAQALQAGGFRKNACIAAAYICKEVLTPLGFEVEPLPVQLQVWNKPWTDFVATHERPPEGDERTDDRWSVGCGVGSPEVVNGGFGLVEGEGYHGHLVSVANREFILDPTLGQASRPNKSIELGPVALPIKGARTERRAFFHGTGLMIYTQACKEPATLLYRAKPKDKSFMRSPDWSAERNTADYRRIAETIRLAL